MYQLFGDGASHIEIASRVATKIDDQAIAVAEFPDRGDDAIDQRGMKRIETHIADVIRKPAGFEVDIDRWNALENLDGAATWVGL